MLMVQILYVFSNYTYETICLPTWFLKDLIGFLKILCDRLILKDMSKLKFNVSLHLFCGLKMCLFSIMFSIFFGPNVLLMHVEKEYVLVQIM